jgi:hypothetical protein
MATFSTVFPDEALAQLSDQGVSSREKRPHGVAAAPIGLMEYYASCPAFPSSPVVLALGLGTTYRNSARGSNVTLSLRWEPPTDRPFSPDPYLYSPANLPRFSLVGYIEPLPEDVAREADVSRCFLERHPDAELWRPGNRIHESWWARLVVREIYWLGGFGDRARIGWMPREEWEGVTMEEVENHRLPGEWGYRSLEMPVGHEEGGGRASREPGRVGEWEEVSLVES